jgi:hypothetical protein
MLAINFDLVIDSMQRCSIALLSVENVLLLLSALR